MSYRFAAPELFSGSDNMEGGRDERALCLARCAIYHPTFPHFFHAASIGPL